MAIIGVGGQMTTTDYRLLKFTAAWCRPCATAQPGLELAANTLGLPLEILDVEISPNEVKLYRVQGIPTVVLVNEKGVEVARITGSHSAEGYINKFSPFL
jgi:thiol-disulfide isomerase/thioredoxin